MSMLPRKWTPSAITTRGAAISPSTELLSRMSIFSAAVILPVTGDPAERHDLWHDRAGVPDDLIPTLRSLLQDFTTLPRLQPKPVVATPEELDRLRSLGYIR